jgi:hypothetical protein
VLDSLPPDLLVSSLPALKEVKAASKARDAATALLADARAARRALDAEVAAHAASVERAGRLGEDAPAPMPIEWIEARAKALDAALVAAHKAEAHAVGDLERAVYDARPVMRDVIFSRAMKAHEDAVAMAESAAAKDEEKDALFVALRALDTGSARTSATDERSRSLLAGAIRDHYARVSAEAPLAVVREKAAAERWRTVLATVRTFPAEEHALDPFTSKHSADAQAQAKAHLDREREGRKREDLHRAEEAERARRSRETEEKAEAFRQARRAEIKATSEASRQRAAEAQASIQA